MSARRPLVLVLGPSREALSGVSTHVNQLFSSRLGDQFSLLHFQVGSEGRCEGAFGRVLRLLRSPFQLAWTIVRQNATLVHLNTSLNARSYWRDMTYAAVAKACGAQVLCQVHGGSTRAFLPRSALLAAALRATLRLPDAIVVLSRIELDGCRALVPRQLVVRVPNGVDPVPYANLPRVSAQDDAPLRLVYIGRLSREKGLYELIQALGLTRGQGIQARLTIAGGGPEKAALQGFAASLGLSDRIHFAGALFGEDKVRLFADADAMVLPSYSEGLPYALLEAMAAGVPAIITRVGAVPDVMTEGVHGWFVEPRDPQAIARAILQLARDAKKLEQMRAACRARIAGGYTIERLADDFCSIYAHLCRMKPLKAVQALRR
jgi:glycosyltransferase involved in cell wall biosynthesis